MTERRLWILGAGGHGKVCAEVAMISGYREIAFLDDRIPRGNTVLDLTVAGKLSDLEQLLAKGDRVFIAVGDNHRRRELFRWLKSLGLTATTLGDPSVIISPSARMGEGALLMPRVVVNADARVGDGAILNTGAIVEHDCDIGPFAHLSPGVCLGGGVRIGETAHLGLGAVVLPNLTVGAGAVAGAGCVVTKDLPPDAVAVGVPARIIQNADSTISSKHYRSRTKSGARGAIHAASLVRQ